jgi:hypothetical protein
MLRAVLLIVNVIVSVGVPLWITRKTNVLRPGEGYIFGALLFIASTTLELLVMSTKAFEKQRQLTRPWETREAIDARLQELRRAAGVWSSRTALLRGHVQACQEAPRA